MLDDLSVWIFCFDLDTVLSLHYDPYIIYADLVTYSSVSCPVPELWIVLMQLDFLELLKLRCS